MSKNDIDCFAGSLNSIRSYRDYYFLHCFKENLVNIRQQQ
jgi:hypothetical protein